MLMNLLDFSLVSVPSSRCPASSFKRRGPCNTDYELSQLLTQEYFYYFLSTSRFQILKGTTIHNSL